MLRCSKNCDKAIFNFSKNKGKLKTTHLYSNITDLDRAYVPSKVETVNLNLNYFNEQTLPDKYFNLILPPPNITGNLHLGHTLTGTIQDVLIRWKRMQGFQTAWIPGLDHAGIATQVIVEKQLWKEQKKTRFDIGRNKFCDKIWDWKEMKEAKILSQFNRMGLSLDWDKRVFTMDPVQGKIVSQVFVNLFEKGLIYRSNSLVNWSCFLRSAISDIEVNHVEINGETDINVPGYKKPIKFGKMIYFAYKLCSEDEEIIVGTTRPETMLGDVAIAVHPNDDRYAKFIGRRVYHPFRKEEIPVVADEIVDKQFGTGAVKVTPAHDHIDFSIAKRHGLKLLQVFDETGKVTPDFQDYEGLQRFEIRNAIIERLNSIGLLRDMKDHKMSIPICSRSNDVIEYLLKPQWFVRCDEMAEKALNDVRSGRLIIEPSQFRDNWSDWLLNIRDWCISRQLWWGHRIPAYLCQVGNMKQWVAASDEASARQKASTIFGVPQENVQIEQDNDVLDTWFSSALLPFSVFGWPYQSSRDFSKRYPLSLMETGHDILFFWVARMVMLGTEMTGQLPFKKILLHGIICDSQGRKMSKSLGNVVSPEDVIDGISLENLLENTQQSEKMGILSKEELQRSIKEQKKIFPEGIPECGADALRFTLLSHNIKSHFINFNVQECHTNKLFCNKIWQATKFVKMWHQKVEDAQGSNRINENSVTIMDRWILSRYFFLLQILDESLENYDFHTATLELKNFLYYDFCDNYLESTKRYLRETESVSAAGHCWTLLHVLDGGLRALHPFMPHLTVYLHQRLPVLGERTKNYPKETCWRDITLENTVNDILETIKGIRRIRKTFNIMKKHNSKVRIVTPITEYAKFQYFIEDLTGCSSISITNAVPGSYDGRTVIKDTLSDNAVLYVTIPEELRESLLVDKEKMERQMEKLENELQKMSDMIGNKKYSLTVPADKRLSHEKRVATLEVKISRIRQLLSIF